MHPPTRTCLLTSAGLIAPTSSAPWVPCAPSFPVSLPCCDVSYDSQPLSSESHPSPLRSCCSRYVCVLTVSPSASLCLPQHGFYVHIWAGNMSLALGVCLGTCVPTPVPQALPASLLYPREQFPRFPTPSFLHEVTPGSLRTCPFLIVWPQHHRLQYPVRSLLQQTRADTPTPVASFISLCFSCLHMGLCHTPGLPSLSTRGMPAPGHILAPTLSPLLPSH